MIRLHFVVEGQTEETFVNQIITPALSGLNIFPDVRCVQTGYKRGKRYKGGITDYIKLKNDLQRWLKQDVHSEARFTTMFDFYALPHNFPCYAESQKQTDLNARIEHLENGFQADIGDPRFIPYIQLHEFEALLFTEPTKFAVAYPNREREIQELVAVRSRFTSPEEINEGQNTCPSKRIKTILPDYNKVSAGPRIAMKIGINKIRAENPHFNDWLTKLEQLN
jgi:hypothetical protein